jgi:hypothetical protein
MVRKQRGDLMPGVTERADAPEAAAGSLRDTSVAATCAASCAARQV